MIEEDGGQHDERGPLDRRRSAFIEAEGFRVIRFWNNEVIGNLDGVLLTILAALTTSHPQPLPQAGGEI